MMEKRNVVEQRRTPDHELDNPNSTWDKQAAAGFKLKVQVEAPPVCSKKPRKLPETSAISL